MEYLRKSRYRDNKEWAGGYNRENNREIESSRIRTEKENRSTYLIRQSWVRKLVIQAKGWYESNPKAKKKLNGANTEKCTNV